jgi:hypothetical protein
MPIAAAEGPITLCEEHLRAHLAACPGFRKWLDVQTVNQALDKIYIDAIPAPQNDSGKYEREDIIALRPYALIETRTEQGFTQARVGTEAFIEMGRLMIAFEQNYLEEMHNQPAQIEREFKNALGVIWREMLERAYMPGFMAIDTITLDGPYRTTKELAESEGYFQLAAFEIRHGTGLR